MKYYIADLDQYVDASNEKELIEWLRFTAAEPYYSNKDFMVCYAANCTAKNGDIISALSESEFVASLLEHGYIHLKSKNKSVKLKTTVKTHVKWYERWIAMILGTTS